LEIFIKLYTTGTFPVLTECFFRLFSFTFIHDVSDHHRFRYFVMHTIVNPHINLFFVSFSTLPHEYTMRVLKFHLLK